MSKHTPGPWLYDRDDKLNPERAYGIVVDLGPQFAEECGVPRATMVIAEVYSAEDDAIAQADARLIAQAPQMLAVLKTVLEHCEGKGWRSDHVAALVRKTIRDAEEDA